MLVCVVQQQPFPPFAFSLVNGPPSWPARVLSIQLDEEDCDWHPPHLKAYLFLFLLSLFLLLLSFRLLLCLPLLFLDAPSLFLFPLPCFLFQSLLFLHHRLQCADPAFLFVRGRRWSQGCSRSWDLSIFVLFSFLLLLFLRRNPPTILAIHLPFLVFLCL